MSREKTVFKNTIILTCGTFLPRILGILTTPLITHYVDPSDIGIISFITVTILTMVVPICTLQLEQSFFRFLIDAHTEEEKKRVITSGSIIIVIIMLLLAIITLFISIDGFTGTYKLLLILYIWIEIIAQIAKFILRAFSMYKQYSLFAIIAVVVNLLSLVVCLTIFKLDYLGVFIALLVSDIVGVIYVFSSSPILSYLKLSYYHTETMQKMLVFALPFIPNMMAYSINSIADRFILKKFLNLHSVGIYDTANKIPNIVSILYPAFNLAWTESATVNVNQQDSSKYYTRMFHMIFRILSGGTALLIAVSPYLFFVLVSQKDKYGAAMHYIPTLIIAMYFLCFAQFFSSIYIARKESKNMSITTIIAAIINIVINLGLIAFIGLQAAIISTFISNLVLAIYRYFDINKKYYKMKVNKKLLLLTSFIFILQVCLYWSYDPILHILNIVIAVFFAYFTCGDIVIPLCKSLLHKKHQ